jgi:hypothetical protein
MNMFRRLDDAARPFARVGVAAALVSLLALTGCAPEAAPVASPAPTVEPASPGPEPAVLAVAKAVIEGDAFSLVLEDGTVSERLSFSSSPDAAAACLTAALGAEPVVEEIAEETCEPAHTRTSWGSDVRLISNYDWLPAGQLFSIVVDAETVNGVAFEAAGGYRVGAPSATLVASVSRDQLRTFGYEGSTYEYVDVDIEGGSATTEDMDLWGSFASAKDGTINRIASPVGYFIGGNCSSALAFGNSGFSLT